MKRKLRAFLIIVGFIFLPTTMVFQNCAPHQSASSINTESSENTSDTENPPNMPTPAPPTPPVPTGPVLNVPSQYATIQAAIDAAQLGDTIVVEAGRTYTENVVLKHKSSGTGWITIQSSKLHLLPAAGNRVGPADAVNMPRIQSSYPNVSVFSTQSGATPSHHYKLVGLEITRRTDSNTNTYSLVSLGESGSSQDTLAEVPHNFVIERCYIHGIDGKITRRGVFAEAKDVEIKDSYFSKIIDWSDSQAILGLNTPGNHLIINNFLEATGENIMYGGGDPTIPNLVPSNILIAHNHFFKPLSWKGNEPGTVKNLFELKNVKEIMIENNIFENNWSHGQSGTAIVFTIRNQEGSAPWSTIRDVTFQYNIVRNVGNGLNLLVTDDNHQSQVMRNININNNLVTTNTSTMDGVGRAYMVIGSGARGPADNIVLNHNTFIHKEYVQYYNRFIEFDASRNHLTNFVVNNNIVAGQDSSLGYIAHDGTQGITAINRAVINETYTYNANAIRRENGNGYPSTSFYTPTNESFRFENYAAGNYVLRSDSPYKNAGTDGKDIGADITELNRRTACVVSGQRSLCP